MKKSISSRRRRNSALPVNAALFGMREDQRFLTRAVGVAVTHSKALVVSSDGDFLAAVPAARRMSFAEAGLDCAFIESDVVLLKLKQHLGATVTGLIIDMQWAIANVEAVTSLERWGMIADTLAQNWMKPVISIYDQDLVIEEQMQAAFRAHRQFLAPSGVHDNPYWIPPALLATASLDQQLAYMLGRIVPDYEGLHQRRKSGEMLARGATPSWMAKANATMVTNPAGTRWHIHCFGQLRVLIGGKPVDWRIAGSTPKKTRTLFAYLLQSGEKGSHAEQISELLWPDEEGEATKRARLHHTIAMLRKILGSSRSVLRNGDYYHLKPPSGSWIDIDTFEQLCRRGLSLYKKGENEAALLLYLAADAIYEGDLFEDLPREYTESELENWCISRRIWLREMALKLQTDMTGALLKAGRTREALDHCMKALALDPASESANADALRIFKLQGRDEAIHRQYRQYMQAVTAVGATESPELQSLYSTLSSGRTQIPKKNQRTAI